MVTYAVTAFTLNPTQCPWICPVLLKISPKGLSIWYKKNPLKSSSISTLSVKIVMYEKALFWLYGIDSTVQCWIMEFLIYEQESSAHTINSCNVFSTLDLNYFLILFIQILSLNKHCGLIFSPESAILLPFSFFHITFRREIGPRVHQKVFNTFYSYALIFGKLLSSFQLFNLRHFGNKERVLWSLLDVPAYEMEPCVSLLALCSRF